MKKAIIFTVFIVFLGWIGNLNAGVLGDIDDDGKIGLNEAVNALQVTSGIKSETSISYIIVWKGSWETGKDYNIYDVAHYEGTSFICLQKHTSVDSGELQDNAVWNILAQKGDKGDKGETGTPVKTVAICVDGERTSFGGDCDCGNGTLIFKLRSKCEVTSDTGSCIARTLTTSGQFSRDYYGSCCVCIPAP